MRPLRNSFDDVNDVECSRGKFSLCERKHLFVPFGALQRQAITTVQHNVFAGSITLQSLQSIPLTLQE